MSNKSLESFNAISLANSSIEIFSLSSCFVLMSFNNAFLFLINLLPIFEFEHVSIGNLSFNILLYSFFINIFTIIL